MTREEIKKLEVECMQDALRRGDVRAVTALVASALLQPADPTEIPVVSKKPQELNASSEHVQGLNAPDSGKPSWAEWIGPDTWGGVPPSKDCLLDLSSAETHIVRRDGLPGGAPYGPGGGGGVSREIRDSASTQTVGVSTLTPSKISDD